MLFDKEAIETLRVNIFKSFDINQEEFYKLFKMINKKMSQSNEFLSSIKDQKFYYKNVRMYSKYKSSTFIISKNNEDIYNLTYDTNAFLGKKNKEIEKIILTKEILKSTKDILFNCEYEEKIGTSSFYLDCNGMKVFFKNSKMHIKFSTSINNQIVKALNISTEINGNKTKLNYSVFTQSMQSILEKIITLSLDKYKEDIIETCQEMYELKKIKSKILKNFSSEERMKANEIFSTYGFSYNRKNKKDTIKEIQEIIMLTLDVKRNVRLGKLDKIKNN